MIIVFDTETNGLVNRKQDYDHPSQPWTTQIGAILYDVSGSKVAALDTIIKPDGWEIPPSVIKPLGLTVEEAKAKGIRPAACDINGIDQERAEREGIDGKVAFQILNYMMSQAEVGVAHNADFDIIAVQAAFHRYGILSHMPERVICTMKSTVPVVKAMPFRYGSYKWPTLQELHSHLFGAEFEDAHNAMIDCEHTAKCYFDLVNKGFNSWTVL